MTTRTPTRPAIETPAQAATDLSEHLQLISTQALAAAARGDLDVLALVKQELAARGVDHQGLWVGFPAARAIAAA